VNNELIYPPPLHEQLFALQNNGVREAHKKKKKEKGKRRLPCTAADSPLFTFYFFSIPALLPSLFLAASIYCVINTVRNTNTKQLEVAFGCLVV
jgi:hypothetical protein